MEIELELEEEEEEDERLDQLHSELLSAINSSHKISAALNFRVASGVMMMTVTAVVMAVAEIAVWERRRRRISCPPNSTSANSHSVRLISLGTQT